MDPTDVMHLLQIVLVQRTKIRRHGECSAHGADIAKIHDTCRLVLRRRGSDTAYLAASLIVRFVLISFDLRRFETLEEALGSTEAEP